jgi:hypothetical protein
MAFSPHERCAQACQARGNAAITAAVAAGLMTRSLTQYLHMLPEPSAVQFPCGVFWFNDQESEKPFGMSQDLIGYPVHHVILDRKVGRYKVPSELLMMRWIIQRSLRDQQLDVAIVPESELVEWRPDKVIDEADPIYMYLVSAQTFVCWVKDTRGLVG